MPSYYNNIANRRFGIVKALTPLGPLGSQKSARWNCICDCGTEFIALRGDLRSGKTRNCGCGPKNWKEYIYIITMNKSRVNVNRLYEIFMDVYRHYPTLREISHVLVNVGFKKDSIEDGVYVKIDQ